MGRISRALLILIIVESVGWAEVQAADTLQKIRVAFPIAGIFLHALLRCPGKRIAKETRS
jgi:hypothetical protein